MCVIILLSKNIIYGAINMHAKTEYLVKVYEDGNIRIPVKVRNQLNITKGSNLIIKVDKTGTMSIDTVNHKIDELRNAISKQLGGGSSLTSEFLSFKKEDNSKYMQ